MTISSSKTQSLQLPFYYQFRMETINMEAKALPSELDGKIRTPPPPPPKALPFSSMRTLVILLLFLAAGMIAVSMFVDGFFSVPNSSPGAGFGFLPCIKEESTVTSPPASPPQPELTQDEDNDLSHWIRPPVNLMHNMSDKELLWRASFVPQLEEYPYERVPKIAFLFLTRGPLPLSPLWEKFFEGHQGLFSIYIHVAEPDYNGSFPASSVFYKRQIPSQPVQWGMITMVDAERRLLANAVLDISNERFILLSESCIPVFNFTTVYNYLMNSHQSFVEAFDDPDRDARGRYKPEMAPEVNVSEWRKGAQWFDLQRKLVAIVIRDTKLYPKFKRYMPVNHEEHYINTMLTIESPELIANRTVTWTDWSRKDIGPHPATFWKAHVNEALIRKIQEGQECSYNGKATKLCFLFARKFGHDAWEPLLQLAPTLLGFG